MNIVLGSAFLLLTGIFYILVSGEKENMAGSFRNG